MAFIDIDVFGKIIAGEIPADIVYDDNFIIAFKDINPKAETHIVLTTKRAIKTAKEATQGNTEIFGHFFIVAKKIAEELNLEGYKLHMNVDEAGGQVIPRVHMHLLSPDYESNL